MASPSPTLRKLAAAALVALAAGGCLKRGPADVTGSIPAGSVEAARREAQAWGARFEANPADPNAAMGYAAALRGSAQHAQAVAVLQQAAIRNPKHLPLVAAYGKALADVGRFKEASEVLARAHLPEKPDWRILSVQGAVADQLGDHAMAQRYYEAALKIAPGEPTVLSNLGLSLALSKRLPEAEKTLRAAAATPAADARVRQNLALVLGLQGKFAEAEEAMRRDLAPAEAAANLSAMKTLVAQPNSWKAIKSADEKKPAPSAKAAKVRAAQAKPAEPQPAE
jgi:Flp pilus assembly protein TadD